VSTPPGYPDTSDVVVEGPLGLPLVDFRHGLVHRCSLLLGTGGTRALPVYSFMAPSSGRPETKVSPSLLNWTVTWLRGS
jgi:hypothetical protein